ncbi:MAG: tRNA pseudouridine(55) synthase TruB [Candidatus Zixiibacteriota bacterium]|nr:MAG: tRNA pseudouridine(55) synthase TruB [candidate division Zixibacteria bacterium]
MVDGILLLNKPQGISSHDLVDRVRKIIKQRRVGHTGILDPMATGLMVLLLGRGTLFSQQLTSSDKKYSANFIFGKTTDSFDGEGKLVAEKDPGFINMGRFEKLCNQYLGKIRQLVPPFSAVKLNGRKMYKVARKGETVPEMYKDVEIYSIKITSFKWPEVNLDIHCSVGTYVRSLAHQMGQQLGCGGYLKSLVRTGIGSFTINQAISLEMFENSIKAGDYSSVLQLVEALPNKPKMSIKPEYFRSILEGKPFIKKYLYYTDYKGPGGCLSLLLGPDDKVLALVKLNYSWGSFDRLDSRDVLGKYVRVIDEGHLR